MSQTTAPPDGSAPPDHLGQDSLRQPRLLPLASLLGEWEADAQAAFDARVKGIPRGPVTGLASLDATLGDCLAPGLHVVHGGPGVGKTALGLQIAAACGCPALYVSAEMRPLELLRRLTARETGTFLGTLKSGALVPADSLALARRTVAACGRLALADACDAWASPEWLREAARAVQGDARHVFLAVDSVHSWAEGAPGELTEYDRLNAALAALRTLAGQLGAPILAIAERNRASMAGGGLSASAGSRKFEYTGESVWDLNEDKDAPPPSPHEKAVTLHVAKNRSGAAGRRVRLAFHGALQRYTDRDAPAGGGVAEGVR